MRAVILAGGQGTRLRPYTTVLPKALVPVGDRPVLVAHAVWAAHRLGRDDLLVDVACGHDEQVRAELAAAGHR